jgi:serine protease Do
MPKIKFTKPRLKATALVIALVISLGAGFFGGYWGASSRINNSTVNSSLSSQEKVVTSESQLISDIAKTVGPSVVSVNVVSQTQDTSSDEDLFGLDGGSGSGTQQEESAGTGIIISSDGLIVTNRHVVPDGTTSVSVTLSDGTELKDVQVVGRTSDSDSLDIAFLKITNSEGHKLTPAVLGDSSQVQVGDSVVAIGNALGQFQNTVTSGIISGYGRSVEAGDSSGDESSESLDDLLQTDAAINEGNSGGPLVNLNGQVIGINTAIASDSQNIGFAIPINDVTGLIKQVEATGKLVRPYLGVRYVPLTPDIASQYSLSVSNGAFVVPSNDPSNPSIVPGSPAAQAGLMANDVITQVDGVSIDQAHSITSVIDQHSVGDVLNLTVVRSGKTIHLSATLAAEPSS